MNVVLGADHAGFEYKNRIAEFLLSLGHTPTDFGTHNTEPIDYPLIMRPVAQAVAAGQFERGIILGGSGNGEAIVANRTRGIRCAVAWNLDSARLSREHNDANMLSLGQRLLTLEDALAIVRVWMATPFAGGRHERRIRMIDA